MGLYSGSASYVRYTLIDTPPEDIKAFVLKRLKDYSFHEIDPGSLSEKSIGWVSAENMASTAFDDLHFVKEPYFVFSLRIDTRRIPALTMKAVLLREEMKLKKATGKELLKKKEKEDLREQVRQSLIKKSLPVPAVYDVCWNFQRNSILFFSCSTAANDEFTQFFLRSFDLKLMRLVPAALAEHVCATHQKPLDLQRLAESLAHG
ncbi:MAG: recombination-associated protein RdgC [Desulfobacterota bacterium]|nr:recombination-associated protein RdgC [Thermodesulfobacteriota bacterium]